MESWIRYLEILGALIQFIGACVVYKNSPGNKAKTLPTFADDDPDKFRKINEHFIKDPGSQLKAGFLILATGLLITLIAIVLK